jgi:rhodanese-related sulfurtransferase
MDAKALKERLDAGGTFRLCMVAPQWQFDAKHIPGSICVSDQAAARRELTKDDEIIVYCSTAQCAASKEAARKLDEAGFPNVWHFVGGLLAWEHMGYPFEGDMAE